MDVLETVLSIFWPAVILDDGTSDLLDADQLREVMPRLRLALAIAYTPPLIIALQEGEIVTPLRVAAFLGQTAHESAELRYWEEIASGKAYEGRLDLGNTEPGDGPRYKGRGPLQLTGRRNYRSAGQALALDLENQPEIVRTPEVGFRTSVWFWRSHRLNELADVGNYREITRKINGGYNGLARRIEYYNRALRVLG